MLEQALSPKAEGKRRAGVEPLRHAVQEPTGRGAGMGVTPSAAR